MGMLIYWSRAALSLLAFFVFAGGARAANFSVIELYQNGTFPETTQAVQDWTWPGVGLSASTVRFPADLLKGKATLIHARLILAWTPNSQAGTTGIQTVFCDDGPSNCQVMGANILDSVGTATPITGGQDLTAAMQAIIDGGAYKHIGFRTLGNGTNGPKVYKVAIEMTWE